MGSVGNVKKLVWEKETSVRGGQKSKVLSDKEKYYIVKPGQETIYNYAKAKFNAAYHI